MSHRKVPAINFAVSQGSNSWVRALAVVLTIGVLGASAVQAADTVTWTGNSGSAWSNAGNWDLNRVPGTAGKTDDIVVIPASAPNSQINVTTGTYTIAQLTCAKNMRLFGTTVSLTIAGTQNPSSVAGNVAIENSSKLNVAGTLTIGGNLSLQSGSGGTFGGVLGGAGMVTVSGLLTWNSNGVMQDGGTTIVDTTGSLNIDAGASLNGRLFENRSNSANSIVTGSVFLNNNSTFKNAASGSFNVIDNQATFNTTFSQGAAGTNAFVNQGTVIRAGTQNLNINLPFTNSGTLRVDGGTVNIAGAFSNFASHTLTGGTFDITGTLKFADANIVTNAATLTLNGATSAIKNRATDEDALANLATIAAGGSLILNGRDLTLSAGGLTVAGTLGGVGMITGDVTNAGTVSPGLSPGILAITGNYTQQEAGTLVIDLAGTAPGTGYDQLLTSGTASVAGTLNIVLAEGFTPTASDTFTILTYGSATGDFGNITGHVMATTWGATSLTLGVAGTAPAKPAHLRSTPRMICTVGTPAVLTATPGAGENNVVEWYTDGCGTTLVPGGASPTVTPTQTTIYYALTRNTVTGLVSTACAAYTLVVGQDGPRLGDFDGDCDVDLADLAIFNACNAGPGTLYPPGDPCLKGDFDGDSDVDQIDFGLFQQAYTGVFTAPFDYNGDGDVDHDDYLLFLGCFSGPTVAYANTAKCRQSDFDADQDVDMVDFAIFQRCFSGTDELADLNCGK